MTTNDTTPAKACIDFSQYAFDAIIFDCDGTLVNTAPLHFEAFRLALEDQGEQLEKCWYQARLSLTRAKLLEEFAKQCSTTIDIDIAVTESELHFIKLIENTQVIPEVGDIVDQFWNVMPMAVVSSGQRLSVLASLDAVSLRHKFDFIITAEDVQKHKPSPEPYLTAAARLKVPSNRCLVFEDTDGGLKSAALAGAIPLDVREFAEIYMP